MAAMVRAWPALTRPFWLSCTLTACAFFIIIVNIYYTTSHSPQLFWLGGLTGTLIAIGFGILAAHLTRSFKVYIPVHLKTVRDFVPLMFASDHLQWTRQQVSQVIKKVVLKQTGINESTYTEDSKFVEDFGLD